MRSRCSLVREALPTVPNCMKLHQRLVTLGIRWMPAYDLGYEQREIDVDCGAFIDEIRALRQSGNSLALEQVLTRARLPTIRAHVRPKTLIYTPYVQGIDRLLRDALVKDGWKVGFYTGEDKSGLVGFLEGDVDVLIDVANEADFSLMDRIGVIHLLGDALHLPVDVSRRDTLNPLVRERMVKDAIKIF